MATDMHPDPPSSTTRLWPAVLAAVSMACVLALIAFVVVRTVRGGDDETAVPAVDEEAQGTVRLEPVTYRNPDPFTESVVTASEADMLAAASTDGGSGGTVTGDTSTLYAGRRGQSPCDVARLAGLLTQDADTTAAWAAAAGVDPSAVGDTVRSYTAVLLTTDTAVTNHTYRSGSPSAYQSVLQAGTPVLVDDQGTPRAQCSCGNPLLPPRAEADADYEGDAWTDFEPERVVQVEPAPTSGNSITVMDLDSDEPVTLPTGTTAELDGLLAIGDHGVTAVAEDGTATVVLDEPVEAAHDDGRGGLVYTLEHDARDEYGYVSGPPSDARRATIWHLPAGESEAVELVGTEGDGTWNQLFGVGRLGERTFVVFAPLHNESAYEGIEELTPTGPLVALDLDSGERTVLVEDAIGWELGVSSISFGGGRLALQYGYAAPDWLVFDEGLQAVPTACSGGDSADGAELEFIEDNCPWNGALNDAGDLVFFGSELATDFVSGEETIRTIDLDTGTPGESVIAEFAADTSQTSSAITQATDGRLAAEFTLASESVRPNAHALRVDGTFIDLPEDLVGTTHQIRLLTVPLVRPLADGSAEDSDTEGDEPAARPEIDPMNMTLPAGTCQFDDVPTPAIELVDGSAETTADYTSADYLSFSVNDGASTWVDLTGDGTEELVVAVTCNWGGSGWANSIVALTVAEDGATTLAAPPLNDYGRGGRGADRLSSEAGLLVISGGEWTESDALCCPSSTFTARWALEGQSWVER